MSTRHLLSRRRPEAPTRRRRVPGTPLAAVIALAVLGGCGSGSDDTEAGGTTGNSAESPSTSASSPSPSTAAGDGTPAPAPEPEPSPSTAAAGGGSPAGTDRCTTGRLAAALRDPGEGAGQRFVTVVLTNRGAGSCRIEGYGGVGLVDGSGRALPTQQVRDTSAPPQSVVLAPGASAVSRLQWTVVPSAGDATAGPCQPEPADLQVIPPDERAPLSVGWPYGPVCAGGRIDQQGYRAG